MGKIIIITFFISCSYPTDIKKILLESRTRGAHEVLSLTSERELIYDRSIGEDQGIDTLIISTEDYQSVNSKLVELDLENIANFQSSTDNAVIDRAMATRLTIITQSGMVYESNSFDRGNPPKELEEMINVLRALVQG